ncbi:MAG: hydrogenase nickel incorporation protein HypB [Acidiphilium sp.]|nr:hydrogenase nickel incorporation protein HypB [Acidiphilium sp.]MDD4935102.1 hydrogenase nickel incorporation protein HypB [Acidiphilium sp.]
MVDTAPATLAEHRHDHDHDAGGARMVRIEQDIMAKNQRYADANRHYFAAHGIFVVNLMSSPGAGKTTLLVRAVEALKGRVPVAVIEGDQQTGLDAARIAATGVPAWQINTGKACHLDAHAIGHALDHLPALDGGILFIENVGNLVCPAGFDLGEAHKVVILSITEGEDKPLKYSDMFHAADLMILNKTDLLPYVTFDADAAIAYARQVNPQIDVQAVSGLFGDGLEAFLAWLDVGSIRAQQAAQQATLSNKVVVGDRIVVERRAG